MISGMTPVLRPGLFGFVTTQDPDLVGALLAEAFSVVREDEGVSLLLPVEAARRAGLAVDLPMRCITLHVFSSLEGVGLTAAVASALASEGIACNMVAAYHHDHVFLPAKRCDRAMEILISLQNDTAGQASSQGS
ncbi:ACT domain-containing protein [uncultured Limimaricola sp.]|uniref:ACT domain-containing protein n=1 Tax=uncultured Limimaricola sp. TaxID=2211667 RepID=UPI0030F8DD5B